MMKITKTIVSFLSVLLLGSSSVFAQSSETLTEANQLNIDSVNVNINMTDFAHRTTLTNGHFGLDPKLKKYGITVKTNVTSFGESMIAGEDKNKGTFRFGTKFGATILLNGKKMNLWEGFFIVLHGEYNAGLSVNGYGNVLLPVNTGLRYPGYNGADRGDGSIYLIQFLSPRQKIIVGKLSMFDMSSFTPIRGGSGLSSFQNLCFVTSPNGITTPSVLGGFFVSESDHFDYTISLYGANNQVNHFGTNNAFRDGVTAYASADKPIKIANMKGKQGVFAVYSTKKTYNLSELFQNISPEGDKSLVGNRYSYGYFFQQNIFESESDKKHAIGLFGQATITDKESTPLNWGVVAGIGGTSPWNHSDNWGVAYFKYALINGLVGLPTNPITPNAGSLQSNESGLEVFYDMHIFPWMTFGADYQFIKPGASATNASFLAFRTRINL